MPIDFVLVFQPRIVSSEMEYAQSQRHLELLISGIQGSRFLGWNGVANDRF